MILKTTLKVAAIALCVSLAAPQEGLAQSFAPVVVVNDDVITGYDVDQRALLLATMSGGRSPDSVREAAIESLITDRLRLQAAEDAGIVPTPQGVRDGFVEIAQRLGQQPGDFLRALQARGITQDAIDQQLGAEVAWRDLLRSQYARRLTISETALEAEMSTAPEALVGTEFLLAEIRVPISQIGRDSALQKARGYVARLGNGESFAALARAESAGATARLGGDLGWQPRSALSPESRRVVDGLSAGRLSNPYIEGDDVVIMAVRDLREGGQQGGAKFELAQLVVAVSDNAPADVVGEALRQAELARLRVTDCASIEAIQAEYAPISGRLGTLSMAEMPGTVREAVRNLNAGEISRPVRSSEGFHVIAVCDRTTSVAASGPDKDQVRERMLRERLDRAARGLLQKLRREAVIERR